MPLTVTAFETVNWSSTTTPLTITLTGALTGDFIAVLYGGDNGTGTGNVTAAIVTTTVGTTTGWVEPQEALGGTSQPWVSSSRTVVTADGDVTASLSRTQATGQPWGGWAARIPGGQLGNTAKLGPGSTKTINLTTSNGSAVLLIGIDWDAAATVAFSPAGATTVEASVGANVTSYAAYWTNQAAGTRAYGVPTSATTNISFIVIEILDPNAAAATGPVQSANPGQTWQRRFKHRQQLPTISAAAGPQNYTQPLNATVGFTSSESVLVGKSLAATAGFTGSLTRRTARTLNAAAGFTGSLASLAVHLFTQALNATVGFTSSQARRVAKALAATVPFTSSDVVRTSKTLAASIAFTGATARRTTRLVSATVAFAGSTTKRTVRAATTATVSFTGSMSSAAVHFFTQAFNATVGFSGSVTTLAVHHFTQALNATLSFTGTLTTRRTATKVFTSTVGFTSSQAKRTGKRITAAASFTSSIARRIATRIVAALPFTTSYDKVGSGSYAPLIDPAAQVHRNAASAGARTNPAAAAPTNSTAAGVGENTAAATARPNDAEATP